ncbi:nitrate transporter permease component [Citrobacter koseri]|uniref:Nitrate transporter permease component n=1 Tax=Citrobacter koseri TaxID=545 RepID=A0A2X2W9M9_CITKO|nr:nitrate transporter permease component [Citrobacter koseri]
MKTVQNVQRRIPEPAAGEVITLPPVTVRRRNPPLSHLMRTLAQRTVPALLGLALLVVGWQLAAINSKGFPTPLSTLDSALTLFADPFYNGGA